MNRKYRLCLLFGVLLPMMAGVLLPTAATPAQAMPQATTYTKASFMLVAANPSYYKDQPFCLYVSDSNILEERVCTFNHTTYDVSPNAKWDLLPAGGGKFQLKSVANGYCLTVGDTQPGSHLVMGVCDALSRRLWSLELDAPFVRFRSVLTGTYLGFNWEDRAAHNTFDTVGSSMFLLPVGAYVQLRSKWSAKCLDVNNSGGGLQLGAKAQQWTCLGWGQTNQLFALDLITDASPYQGPGIPAPVNYRLVPRHSGKVIARVDDPSNGIQLFQWDYDSTFHEKKWFFLPVRVDSSAIGFQVQNWAGFDPEDKKCMDVDNRGGVPDNGDKVQQWECLSAAQTNQVWFLYRVTP